MATILTTLIRTCAAILRRLAHRLSWRLLAFGIVGVSGALLRMVLLWLLVGVLGIHSFIAPIISAEIPILTNFVMNDRWTFRDSTHHTPHLRRLVSYHTFTAGGVVVSLVIYAVLTSRLHMHYLLANLIAIGFTTVANYGLNIRFTWATKKQPSVAPLNAVPETP